jgi:hypothetical protein
MLVCPNSNSEDDILKQAIREMRVLSLVAAPGAYKFECGSEAAASELWHPHEPFNPIGLVPQVV